MIPAIQNSSFLSFSTHLCSAIKNKAVEAYQGANEYLNTHSKWIASGMTLAALGIDVAFRRPLLSFNSTTFLNGLLFADAYIKPVVLRTIFERYSGKRVLDRVDEKGRTALHRAIEESDLASVKSLVAAGASITVADREGCTPLHYAVRQCESEIARTLIEAGADPYVEDLTENQSSSFDLAVENIELIQIITRIENIAAFNSCENAHDFLAILFPPSKEELPADWEAVVQKIPLSPLLDELEKEASLLEKAPPSLPEMIHYLGLLQESMPDPSLPLHIHFVRGYLSYVNPLFAKAWNAANTPEKLTLESLPDETFTDEDGYQTQTSGENADYSPSAHKIRVSDNGSYAQMITGLIFETMNAVQRTAFIATDEWVKAGETAREEYAVQTEFIESQSNYYSEIILNPDQHCDRNFAKIWKKGNTPYGRDLISHTDDIRLGWDKLYTSRYLQKTPDFLQKRIIELTQYVDLDDEKGLYLTKGRLISESSRSFA